MGTDCLEVHSIASFCQLLSIVIASVYIEQRKKGVVDNEGCFEMYCDGGDRASNQTDAVWRPINSRAGGRVWGCKATVGEVSSC